MFPLKNVNPVTICKKSNRCKKEIKMLFQNAPQRALVDMPIRLLDRAYEKCGGARGCGRRRASLLR